jgi:hypothetical protein
MPSDLSDIMTILKVGTGMSNTPVETEMSSIDASVCNTVCIDDINNTLIPKNTTMHIWFRGLAVICCCLQHFISSVNRPATSRTASVVEVPTMAREEGGRCCCIPPAHSQNRDRLLLHSCMAAVARRQSGSHSTAHRQHGCLPESLKAHQSDILTVWYAFS